MIFRTGLYLKKIGGVILIASVIIWILSNFPRTVSLSKDYTAVLNDIENIEPGDTVKDQALRQLILEENTEKQSKSYMGMIGRAIEPVMKPLGFDWRLSVAILSGIAAKEVVVSTLGVLFQTDSETAPASLVNKIQSQKNPAGEPLFTPVMAFSVVAAIRRESGSWKWAAFVVIYTTGMAWLLSFTFYQLGSLLML